MKLAIADPPYLGRSNRWYGDGRGSGRTTAPTTNGHNARKPDYHPAAAEWDRPEKHVWLLHALAANYDGWAVAGASDYVGLLLDAAPKDANLAIWHRPNAMPGGGRLHRSWEPVVIYIPKGRRDRKTGPMICDVLTQPVLPQGFLGSKPAAWTNWVLEMLGFDPAIDTVVDIFNGSGAVASAIEKYERKEVA